MKTLTKISLFFFISILYGYKVSHIGKFLYVNSIVRQGNLLVVATDGGVFTYNLFNKTIENSIITTSPVKLAVTQNALTGYFVDLPGNLYRWDIPRGEKYFLTSVGNISSLGICCGKIYTEHNGSIIAYTTGGVRIGLTKPSPTTLWVGRLNSLKKGDDKILFLQPYFFTDKFAGKIDLSYFYKDFSDLWVGTRGMGIYHYNYNLKLKDDSIQIGLPFKQVKSMATINGKIYIGGDYGIVKKGGPVWHPFLPGVQSGLNCPSISKLVVLENKLVVGTDCGIQYLSPYGFRDIKSRGKLLGAFDNEIFVQNGDYIFSISLTGAKLTSLEFPYDVKDTRTLEGKLLILANDRLYTIREKSVTPLYSLNKFAPIYAFTTSSHSIYALTESGILKMKDGIVEKLAYPFIPYKNRYYPMIVAHDQVFIGTVNGVYVYDGRNKSVSRIWRELHNKNVLSLLFSDGKLFVGTANGLNIIKF